MTYFCFAAGKTVTRILGQNLIMVISRIMGLILSVIGTQMLIEGVKQAIEAN